MTPHWWTYVPQPTGVIRLCPRCVLTMDNGVLRLKAAIEPPYPWLLPLCEDCDSLRESKQRFLKKRLKWLAKPRAVIGAWELKEEERKDGFVPHCDVERDGVIIPRRLAKPYRHKMIGQLALEYAYIRDDDYLRANGTPGPETTERLDKEIKHVSELLACVVCRRKQVEKYLWLCDPCQEAWRREGRPSGDDYVSWAFRRKWPEIKMSKLDAELRREIRLEQEQKKPHSRLSLGRESSYIDSDLKQFWLEHDNLPGEPWRDRLADFYDLIHRLSEATPMLSGSIKLEYSGSPDVVEAAIQRTLGAIAAAALPVTESIAEKGAVANIVKMRRPS